MSPYLVEADGDETVALELYKWNAELSGACFEVLGHLEVLLRNAIDSQLRIYFEEVKVGIPWFLLKIAEGKVQTSIDSDISTARMRLQRSDQDTRHQIIASTYLGFWTGLLSSSHDQLWRRSIHKAFPGSSGVRADLASACNGLQLFRNRLAHPNSLLAADVPFQLRQALAVASWIDPAAETWMRGVERVTTVYSTRPVQRFDTVVVPARDAWLEYENHGVYICQQGRTFRPVQRFAFYEGRSIKSAIPLITGREDNVEWSLAEQAKLLASPVPSKVALGNLIADTLGASRAPGRYQVFWLTKPGDPRHRELSAEVPHLARGRGQPSRRGSDTSRCMH